jgi:hypothetical protein
MSGKRWPNAEMVVAKLEKIKSSPAGWLKTKVTCENNARGTDASGGIQRGVGRGGSGRVEIVPPLPANGSIKRFVSAGMWDRISEINRLLPPAHLKKERATGREESVMAVGD